MIDKFRLPFSTADDDYARQVEASKAKVLSVAAKIEAGEAISRFDVKLAAHVLRLYAENLPKTAPLKVGQLPKIDPANVALRHEILLLQGHKKLAAKNLLAEEFDVSVESIRKAVKKFGPDARTLLCGPNADPPNQKKY